MISSQSGSSVCLDNELACNEIDDPRQWVDIESDEHWPDNWHRPVTLVHYPPRRGVWFWERWHGFGARCPAGSIIVAPRPLTDEEVDEITNRHAEQYNALLCMVERSYLVLRVGTIRTDGRPRLEGQTIVPAWRGQWENQVQPCHTDQIDRIVHEIMSRPAWGRRVRRRRSQTLTLEASTGSDEAAVAPT